MATTSDVSVGMVLRYNGELCQVTEWLHRTPGNLRAFYQAKMKNLVNGKSAENRFRSGESVEIVKVMDRQMQYLYKEGDMLNLMDPETFEQITIPELLLGDVMKFIKEEDMIRVFFEEDNPIMAEGPNHVELEITYTEPGLKGDTATNTLKAAEVETGATVNVPLFVNQGEKIKIDTRTGQYVERVKG